MTLPEMIIEVRHGLQQYGAMRNRDYEDGELVLALVKAEGRFISLQLEDKQNGLYSVINQQQIAPLLVTGKIARCRSLDATYAFLPGTLQYLLSTSALLSCDNRKTTPVYNYTEVQFKKTTKNATPYYNVVVKAGADEILNIPALYVNKGGAYELSEVVDTIADLLEKKGIDLYRDYLGAAYPTLPGFEDVRTLFINNTQGAITVSIDGTAMQTKPVTINGIAQGGSVKTVPVEPSSGLVLHKTLKTPYYKPSTERCVGSFFGRELAIYAPENTIVVGALFNYVRKPRRMNLILRQNCELPDSEHSKIVDLAVEEIMSAAGQENYQMRATDTERREKI